MVIIVVICVCVTDKLALTINFALPDSPSNLTPYCDAPQRNDTVYERTELSLYTVVQ